MALQPVLVQGLLNCPEFSVTLKRTMLGKTSMEERSALYGHSFAGTAGSNPADSKAVRLLCLLCVV
jgi:hypothetical protein